VSASGDGVRLRTPAPAAAAAVLGDAGATIAATGSDVLTISGISSERIVALLAGNSIPFAEVSAHRASLEEAYLELTQEAVEYRAAAPDAASSAAAPAGQVMR
jgi:ABC-2 type transport system ATP-binding protein